MENTFAMGKVISWEDMKAKAKIKSDPRKNRFAGLWENEHVQRIVSHTFYRWVYSPDNMGEGCLMFHRPTDAPHAFLQIVLGSDCGDGVYELSIRRRHKIQSWMHGKSLTVQSTGTLDLVEIPGNDSAIGFSAMEMGQEAFEQALIDQGLLTASQLQEAKQILSCPTNILPRVQFVDADSPAIQAA